MAVVLLTGIGDVVHGLPLAVDLKRDDPARRVLWVAEPGPAEVVRHHSAVDEVVVFHKSRGLAGLVELRDELRGRRCDLALNMQRYFKSVWPTLFSGAPVRVGLPPSKTRDGVAWFNTHHLPEQPWRHVQDLLLDYRPVLGLPTRAPVEWRLAFTASERGHRRDFLADLPEDRPMAGVVLASANPAKDWPARASRDLVRALERDLGYSVLLLGGPSAREREVARTVGEGAGPCTVDARGDSVRRMMALVEACDLLVSPDTGPLHLAHALGTPVVGLYGHTNPWRVGPYRRFRDLVIDRYTEPGTAPDPSAYGPKHGRVETITVEDVLGKVERARSVHDAGRPRRSGAARRGEPLPAPAPVVPGPGVPGP